MKRGPNLFEAAGQRSTVGMPLAERLRPRSLDEVVGQEQVLGTGRALQRLLKRGEVPSMVLWGPPGTGKTSLARLLANLIDAEFVALSAVMSGVKDLREVVAASKERRNYHRQRTILFIDELHRFNKAQQDALLPHVESGLFTLIGATTENPSFELNSALLSRCRVFVLEALGEEDLQGLLRRALADNDRGLGELNLSADDDAIVALARGAHGDARRALGALEVASDMVDAGGVIDLATVEEANQHRALLYDKAGDEHYNVVSAFIKSLRGSDADGAAYWLVRMLEAGEDPRFILRRLVIFASEDVGNADPQALAVAVNAMRSYEFVGMPEGALPMTQAVTYLASAPKSNSALTTYAAARKDVREFGALAVPKKLRNAATGLMQNLGYGKDYKYPHNFDGHYVDETYLPEELIGRRYYQPSDQGAEAPHFEKLQSRQTFAESDDSE